MSAQRQSQRNYSARPGPQMPSRPGTARSSELARPLIPVTQMVRQTYHVVGYHANDLTQLGAMPLAIAAAVQALYLFSPTAANLIFSIFGNILASSIFAVGLNRLILDNEKPRPFGLQLGRREFVFALMALLTIAPVFLVTLALFGGGYLLSQHFHSQAVWNATIIGGVAISILLASYAAVRFSFLFPSIALDRSMALKMVLSQTRRQGVRIWLGLLLCLSPVLVVTGALTAAAIIYHMPEWALEMIHGFGAISALPLSIVFLALNYERLIIGRVIEREYVVLPRHARTARGNSALARHVQSAFLTPFRFVVFLAKVAVIAAAAMKPKPKPKMKARTTTASSRQQTARRPVQSRMQAQATQSHPRPVVMQEKPAAQDVLVRSAADTTSSIRMIVEMNGLAPEASALVHLMAENLRHMDEQSIQRVASILSGKEAPPPESNVVSATTYTEQQTRAIIAALAPRNGMRARKNAPPAANDLNKLVKKI